MSAFFLSLAVTPSLACMHAQCRSLSLCRVLALVLSLHRSPCHSHLLSPLFFVQYDKCAGRTALCGRNGKSTNLQKRVIVATHNKLHANIWAQIHTCLHTHADRHTYHTMAYMRKRAYWNAHAPYGNLIASHSDPPDLINPEQLLISRYTHATIFTHPSTYITHKQIISKGERVWR